ncbi:hypothetical protein A33O_09564 [Nitratireductor aquibiodomus RA22]|uniref:Uncharacterized protein n=1 Tax=Nitratireductor aquibiodomus RA22 TaxID=1189611 RepID=I5BZS9_9HYPH|nr:hypothetical protein A33O_09564 [Nitratireductor aquibiodomus RA22]
MGERLSGCGSAELGHGGKLVVGPGRNIGRHARGIENAVTLIDVTLPDAGSMLDELRIGLRQRRQPLTSLLGFSMSTQALKLSTSSSFEMDASGISTPIPPTQTRVMALEWCGAKSEASGSPVRNMVRACVCLLGRIYAETP